MTLSDWTVSKHIIRKLRIFQHTMKLFQARLFHSLTLLASCFALQTAWSQSPFLLPLRLEASGTCIGNGSTAQTIETTYGSTPALLAFSATTTYDFYSPPITVAPALAPTDKAAGKIWLTNGSPSGDFDVTVRLLFFDYDPTSGLEMQIADSGVSGPARIKHLQASQAVTPNTSLPAASTPVIGHLLHIKLAVTLINGTPSNASILLNAPNGVDGDSFAMLPQNKTTKTWSFGPLTASPSATITPSASSVLANSTGNTASVSATPGATYAWTITGGSLTAGQGTSQITWTAGATGPVNLGVTVTKGCSSTASAAVQVIAPTTQGAPPSLSIGRNGDGTVTVTLQGTPGAQYLFQTTSNLVSPAWTTLSSSIAGLDGITTFMDADSAIYPARFYRAVVP